MRPPQIPLIPANAGTQILRRRVQQKGSFSISARIQPFDLGPGIRRDERWLDALAGSPL